jgi:hypothetical protein
MVKWAVASCAIGLLTGNAVMAQTPPSKESVEPKLENTPAKVSEEQPPEAKVKPSDAPKPEKVTDKKPTEVKTKLVPPEYPTAKASSKNKVYDAPPKEYKPTYNPAPYVAPKIFDVIASPDGKTLHVVGRIDAGITTALKTALKANTNVTKIALSSEGGSLVEGVALAHVIREAGLDTYVEFHCFSSCTFPFLAGKDRVISPNAKIGFHQSSNKYAIYTAPKKDAVVPGGDLLMRNIYAAAKIDPAIIEQALKTPPTDIWMPSTAMMLSGNIATRMIKPDEGKTASGTWQTSDKMIEQLNTDPILKDIFTLRPTLYYRNVGELWNDSALGKNSYNAKEKVTAKVIRMLLSDLDQYPDDIVDAYVQLENEMWQSDEEAYSVDCGYYLPLQAPIIDTVSEEFSTRYQNLLKSMAAITVKPIESSETTNASNELLFLEFFGHIIANDNVTSTNVTKNFCSDPRSYFSQLAKMPRDKRLQYTRAILSSTKSAATPTY